MFGRRIPHKEVIIYFNTDLFINAIITLNIKMLLL